MASTSSCAQRLTSADEVFGKRNVNRIGGAILVLAGLYIGYYGVYELRLFHGGGSAEDPIVDGAGKLQALLAELPRR